jgi:hypothetical protein
MKDVSDKNFGVIIAFLLPGFLFLWGLSYSSTDIATWLARSTADHAPTVGGFLYATLASLAIGLLISAVRWLVIDHIHEWTGVPYPDLNFTNLKDKDRYAAFVGAVENHFRYYQYYSNTLISAICAFICYLCTKGNPSLKIWVATIAITIALFLGSRDALKKYYDRAKAILS